MPTEDDNTPAADQIAPSILRPNFSSCPPEEERDADPVQEVRLRNPPSASAVAGSSLEDDADAHTTTSSRDSNAQLAAVDVSPQDEKAVSQEDASIGGEPPSSVGSPETGSDADMRLAQSLAGTALHNQPNEEAPSYQLYPQQHRLKLPPTATSSFLHPGSKFRGTQQSDRQVYDVQVEIKDVDLSESTLCGYLRIQGLTDDHPTLTTFFEGEIVGPKYLFKTQHPSWNSSEKIDLQHWARFPAWRPLAKSAKNSSIFTLKNYLEREHLFMRWKEYFLVPDHRVKSISGASFEGFYYICFDQRVGTVSGIYFHAKSEKYQQLELRHVSSGGCMGAMEFR